MSRSFVIVWVSGAAATVSPSSRCFAQRITGDRRVGKAPAKTPGERVSNWTTATVRERLLPSAVRALLLVTAVAAGGCGLGSLTSGLGGGLFGGSASPGSTEGVSQEGLLSAAKADGPVATSESAPGCPRFTIVNSDSSVSVFEPGRVGDSLGVAHRGEITKTARECTIEGNRVTVRYGFSGRVLLGPRGKSGNVQLPLTVYVADGKKERVVNERLKIDVPVALDKPIGYFSTVRQVSFQVPEGSRAGEFEIFVGFDRSIPNSG
jgi:hypothetical protein